MRTMEQQIQYNICKLSSTLEYTFVFPCTQYVHFKEATIPDLECKIIVSILQDCIIQLNILGYSVSIPIEKCIIKYKSPSKRFGSPEEKQGLETSIKLSLYDKKLQRKRTFLEGIIYNTISEIKYNRKCNFLLRAVNYMEKVKGDEEYLIEMEALNQYMVQNLQTDVSEMQKNAELKVTNKLKMIAQLKDKLTDETNTRKVIKNFVEKWEKNLFEQLNRKLTNEFNSQNEKLIRASKDFEDELKINENLMHHLTEACGTLKRNIEHWKEKYNSDIGNLEDRVLSLKHFKEQQLNKFQQLEEVFNIHEREMNEFIAIKEERKRKESQEVLEYESAVRLQAWWRGLMVRRCLGQFRRHKKVTKDPKVKKRKGGKSPKAKNKK